MDTKWNNTAKAALPGETAEAPYTGSPRKRQVKAVAAFLAFFFGLSLVLGSLGAALGRWAWQRGSGDIAVADWQETESFRQEVSSYLREFLELGAGEDLDWYNDWYGGSVTAEREVILSDWGWEVSDTPIATSEPTRWYENAEADAKYQDDTNVLYCIRRQPTVSDGSAWYKNVENGQVLRLYSTLPEGYNFLLVFENGQVSIRKDGAELDVYGGGIYTEDSDWFVPGYDNFPAGDNVNSVAVYMAFRETPIQYYKTDYGVQTSRMYWVYRNFQENREFWLTQAALLGAGVLLLAVWFLLRRERRLADGKIASWTIHVWTELRFLAVTVPLCTLLLPRLGSMAYELWYEILYEGLFAVYMLSYLGRALAASLENTGALLCLWWAVWLIRNDHKYNPKSERRSLWRHVSLQLPKYSFQKRMTWRNRIAALFMALLALACLFLVMSMGFSGYDSLFWMLMLPFCLVAAAVLFVLRKNAALARDIGLLADQVEAIRAGDLSTPLDLPADGDLRQTAEALNDIQAGLNRALEERTRSERMKVELISNVSHDLKTPLTSILSYAELLRQEPLEGAAADYARIIDEKAQRLKAMVQDVFEVSKAASGQLPVQPERLDFAKLLRQTLADLEDPIQESGLSFKVDLPEGPVMVMADGKRLYRVFQNLITNALQYALPGSRVYLTLKTGKDRAEASLRNTSRDELPEGMDFTARFVRGDESRTDGGSGLGLSIAKSFTEACGGDFRVETVADLFTAIVTLPLA